MIKINSQSNPSYIKGILEKDIIMLNSILSSPLPQHFRNFLGIILNQNYKRIYNFATEDIRTYISKFPNLKKYLTICSSGDQAINGILYGATHIETFDKNYFAKHSLFLKIPTIAALSNEELIEFFTKFDFHLLEKILQEADPMIQWFWEKVFTKYKKEVIEKLFGKTRLSIEQIKAINPYLDPENYEKVKEQFCTMYKENKDKICSANEITSFYFQKGLTYQNLAYSMLYDLFKEENIKEILTNHIVYGHSPDPSHDAALVLMNK